MKLPYIVYLNKSYDVWVRDAYEWAHSKGWKKDIDYNDFISEVIFWHYMEKGLLQDTPVFFVKDILIPH